MQHYHYPQFFTATILNWKKLLKPDKYKQIIINSLQFMVENNLAKIFSFVIMPNHMHILWLIDEKHKREDVQRDLLKFTAQQILFDLKANHPQVAAQFLVNEKDRNFLVWERNPRSIDLFTTQMIEQKLDYIHNNPLQEHWKLADTPEDYYWSSAAFYMSESNVFPFLTHYAAYL